MAKQNRWFVGLGISAAVNTCFWPAILAFVRIEEMRLPYLLAVILFTTIGSVLVSKIAVGHAVRAATLGSFVGFVASVLALQIAKLFDRPEAAFQGVGQFSALSMLAVDAVVALLLGGWLAGVLSALVVSRLKAYRLESPAQHP
jgi:hypothetical protein